MLDPKSMQGGGSLLLPSGTVTFWTYIAAGVMVGCKVWAWRHKWLPFLSLTSLQGPPSPLAGPAASSGMIKPWLLLGGAAILPVVNFTWLCVRHWFIPAKGKVLTGENHRSSSHAGAISSGSASAELAPVGDLVNEADLAVLLKQLAGEDVEEQPWEKIVEKATDGLAYVSYRRDPVDGGTTQYLSRTTFANCTPEMLRDFYMDDSYRAEWDSSLSSFKRLDFDPESGVEVAHYLKKFPIVGSQREYVLAWRLWKGGEATYYCVTKACHHPDVPIRSKPKRVEVYRSSWSIKAVPPLNPGEGPAAEIAMVFQEDTGMQRNMAKMAIRRGLWTFVKRMEPAFAEYCKRRRGALPSSQPVENACTRAQKVPDHLDPARQNLGDVPSSPLASGAVSVGSKPVRRRRKRLVLMVGALFVANALAPGLGTKVAATYLLQRSGSMARAASMGRR